MPTPPAEPSAPAEGDISPEIPDDLREALESGYAEAKAINPFFIAGVYYYIFNYVVAGVMELFEKKLNYYH